MTLTSFQGLAKKLDDIDLPLIGKTIGVGEDAIHAILDTETRGSGFDAFRRPTLLFEPHVFYRQLKAKGDQHLLLLAVSKGLAYQSWGDQPYPKESYTRLQAAYKLAPNEALMSASWGLGQLMGFNYALAGYKAVEPMVSDFMLDEEYQLRAMVKFIISAGLDDDLRALDQAKTDSQLLSAAQGFARGYNGAGFAKNGYDKKLVSSIKRWRLIKDTPIPKS